MRPPIATVLTLFVSAMLHAQNPPAPAAIGERLDTPQVRVFVATLQPRTPAISRNGHATNRVLIYMDDGVMTRKEGADTATINFRRGDVRWRPASGPYTAENISDHPIRILEIDLKGAPAGPAPVTKLDPVAVDPQHYKVEFENEFVRVARALRRRRDGRQARTHPQSRGLLPERSTECESGRCADVGSGDARRVQRLGAAGRSHRG